MNRRARGLGASLVGCAVLLGALGAAPAAGLPAGDSATPIQGDGSRFVTYVEANGTPISIDLKSRSRRALPGAENCRPLDAAKARILLACESGESSDTRTQSTISPFQGLPTEVPGSEETNWFDEIGDYWVRGDFNNTDYSTEIYSNWRTGKIELCGLGCFTDFNLNVPKARAPAPYPKVMNRVEFPTTPAKDRKFCFDTLFEDRRISIINYDQLYVWKANMKRPKAVGPRARGCLAYGKDPGVEFGSGKITWVVGKRLFVVNRTTLKRRSVTLRARGTSAVPTFRGVVAAIPRGDGSSSVKFVR